MNIDPSFMCDALDDLADCEPLPPFVADLPRGFIPLFTRSRIACAPLAADARQYVRTSALPGMVGTDPEFLFIVAPDLYLSLSTMAAAACAYAQGLQTAAAASSAYRAVDGARNALRSDLHSTGVI